jgi:cell division protein FtsB
MPAKTKPSRRTQSGGLKAAQWHPYKLNPQWKKLTERFEELAARNEQLKLKTRELQAESEALALLCQKVRARWARG